ncbi:MAG: sterol desaturase family protein [Bacteroidota bacterium]
MDIVSLVSPAFFFLIIIELVVGFFTNRELYRFNDSIANLSCGIGSQVLGMFYTILILWIFNFIFINYHVFEMEFNVVNSILLYVIIDFIYYWFHRWSHVVNLMWAAHVVHHSSEEYNLSVALRQSWLEAAFNAVFTTWLAFFFSLEMFMIVYGIHYIYGFWVHTKLVNRLPKPLEYIFATPSHHRVHHGRNPQYIDKNYGGTFIFWDRLFGTFEPENEQVVYGITTQLKTFNPFYANWHYWKEISAIAHKSKSLKDKISTFFKFPGWFPNYLGGIQKAPAIDWNSIGVFDIKVSKFTNFYVFFQFLLVLGLTSYFQFGTPLMLNSGNVEKILFALALATFIMLSLYVFSVFLENKSTRFSLEIVRFMVFGTLLYFLRQESWVVMAAIALFAIVLVSLTLLLVQERKHIIATK